jgi:MoxR-like ATPase
MNAVITQTEPAAERAEDFRENFQRLQSEIERSIVGQREVVRGLLTALFAEGHVLLEGAPGLGKTLLVRVLAAATGFDFSRIQFTPDLMPADIVGTNLIVEEDGRKSFRFQPGPVFAHILLADEINRATPKTQSALLEAMQERHVTVGGHQHALPAPFLVLATQNPLEMEGTYPLPEAQLDRFLLKLIVNYPSGDELHGILDRTTTRAVPETTRVLDSAAQLREFQALIREVPVVRDIQDRAVRLVLATHPEETRNGPLAKKYVRYGASPRGAQALILCAKIHALLDGRYHVATKDIDAGAIPALRHRIVLNFEGEADGISTEAIVKEALAAR